MDMHWVIKHLFKKYLQMLLKELSLYHPLQLSCKCKVSLLKGGGRGVENEELTLDHHLLLLVGQWSIPQQNAPVRNIKQHQYIKIRASGMSNIRKWERSTEGRWEGIWKNACFKIFLGACGGITNSFFSSSSSFWFQILKGILPAQWILNG